MKKITKITNYWLFKPVYGEAHKSELRDEYIYVRVQTEGDDTFSWRIGYENKSGDVNFIACDLMSDAEARLEKEFQEKEGWVEPIHQLIREGLFLQAVKTYRDITDCGLREAKDYVDNMRTKIKLLP